MVNMISKDDYELTISQDKTIKLWKVYERSLRVISESTMITEKPKLSLPKMSYQDTIVAAIPRRIYANGN